MRQAFFNKKLRQIFSDKQLKLIRRKSITALTYEATKQNIFKSPLSRNIYVSEMRKFSAVQNAVFSHYSLDVDVEFLCFSPWYS